LHPSGNDVAVAAFRGAINFYLPDAIVSSERGRHEVFWVATVYHYHYAFVYSSSFSSRSLFTWPLPNCLSLLQAFWRRCRTSVQNGNVAKHATSAEISTLQKYV